MDILFVHQNFPGQYRHVASALAAQGHRVTAIGNKKRAIGGGVDYHAYQVKQKNTPNIHPWLLDYESKILRGQACAELARHLAQQGLKPDVICVHPGWGEALFLDDVWPDAPQLHYIEYFYNHENQDMGFDPEFSNTLNHAAQRLRVKNTNNVMNLMNMTAGICPTQWQASTVPQPFQSQISVIHDGIDTRKLQANALARLTAVDGDGGEVTFTQADEVVTFVNRNLEPLRGYHCFMRALPQMMQARPHAHFVIIGQDGVSYGPKPPRETWKAIFLDEVKDQIDPSRLHYLGRVDYSQFVAAMQISKAHVYLSYPFVLSWSLLEAMAMEAPIIASATAPVMEVIEDGVHGHLVNFFDVDALAQRVVDTLANPAAQVPLRKAARARVVERYDLRTQCLPAQIQLIKSLAKP